MTSGNEFPDLRIGEFACADVKAMTLSHRNEVRRNMADPKRLDAAPAAPAQPCEGDRGQDRAIFDARFDQQRNFLPSSPAARSKKSYNRVSVSSWPAWRKEMPPIFFFASFVLLLFATSGPSHAGDWRSKYTTGRDLQSCCGDKDCRTAAALGFPKIIRRGDGGYDVKVNGYWIKYDFPAVHVSQDKNTWICYLESYRDPDPLCLFLPPGII